MIHARLSVGALSCALVASFVCFGAGAALAGDLTPPAGSVVGTMKPLSDVEPRIAINAANTPGDGTAVFKIVQPGSYYLTGNLTGVGGKSGILIASSDVTIDLCGFTLKGVAGSQSAVAVASSSVYNNIAVANGTMDGWGGYGVALSTGSNRTMRVSRVTVVSCGTGGMYVPQYSTVSDCLCTNNAGSGYWGQGSVTFIHCSAHQNSAHGFYTEDACNLTDCTADGNTFNGIGAGSYSLITNCSCTRNHWDGVRLGSYCRVSGVNAAQAGYGAGSGAGIHATGSGNRIEGNNCTASDWGVLVDASGNFVNRNTCSGNTTNFSIASGNACYVVSANSSGAISGSSGGLSFGSNDPNANFSY